jgi:hypothetical protein
MQLFSRPVERSLQPEATNGWKDRQGGRLEMNSHIDIARLQQAAERKIWLDSREWKHIEECRQCLDDLTEVVRIHGTHDVKSAA